MRLLFVVTIIRTLEIACQDPSSGWNEGLPEKILVDLEGSQAAVHHPLLQGEYELVSGGLGPVLGEGNLNSNNSLAIPPVWQKSDKKLNKKFYIFQRNGDWIISYCTIPHPNISVSVYYSVPGIIHQDWDTTVLRPGGWLYLSRDRIWVEDPGIRVAGVRDIQKDGIRMRGKKLACPPETDTDYPGHDLQSLASSDLDTCVRMCRSRDTCKGVTWTTGTCQMKFRMLGSVRRDKNVGVWSVRLSCGDLDISGLISENLSLVLVLGCLPCLLLLLVTVTALTSRSIKTQTPPVYL